MIKIATAECFTHGVIARQIHNLAQNYYGDFGADKNLIKQINNDINENYDFTNLSISCGLFIPTLEAVKKVLKVENPPKPYKLIKGIKVYNEEDDKKVARIMGQAVKEISDADIGIGTTAGIGRGGIAIITNKYDIISTTNVYADLIECDCDKLSKRQKDGVKKTIEILIYILNGKINQLNKDFNNIEIYKK
ncbi:MAG: FeGP cofactor biosynthesis protein HcgF family protein [Methanobrevibacter wolinii]|uniref:FeGP cofactor biosynthesis protein HcgF family protein n=1 Tax=Methanobrevibacter wolinii TaxID=190977 RepID=UPI0005B27670|nr:FeGP cofactor biosynthesis protein HcgF family protein [Methanobrevibacter wolinii]MDD5959853.1 FeGP cofactor biosynthesis protein HcgF family protein [Methanobrevibacter wolinii]